MIIINFTIQTKELGQANPAPLLVINMILLMAQTGVVAGKNNIYVYVYTTDTVVTKI